MKPINEKRTYSRTSMPQRRPKNPSPGNTGKFLRSVIEIFELLDQIWLGGRFPVERDARKAGYQGSSARFHEVREMWGREQRRQMKAFEITPDKIK